MFSVLRIAALWTMIRTLAVSLAKCVGIIALWSRTCAKSYLLGALMPPPPWPVLRGAATDMIGALACYRLMSRVFGPIRSGKKRYYRASERMLTDGQLLALCAGCMWLVSALFGIMYWYDAPAVIAVMGVSGLWLLALCTVVFTTLAAALLYYESTPAWAIRQESHARMRALSEHRRILSQRSKHLAA